MGGGGQLIYIVSPNRYVNIQSVFGDAGPEQSLVLYSFRMRQNFNPYKNKKNSHQYGIK